MLLIRLSILTSRVFHERYMDKLCEEKNVEDTNPAKNPVGIELNA